MREVLFKGKCKRTGKWYYGDLDQAHGFKCIKYAVAGGKGYRTVECIPETIGQFIGLLDKNDNLIFEGDIFKECDFDGNLKRICKVEWDDSRLGWAFPMRYCDEGFNDDDFFNDELVEVIGNIHDNPKLLEDN